MSSSSSGSANSTGKRSRQTAFRGDPSEDPNKITEKCLSKLEDVQRTLRLIDGNVKQLCVRMDKIEPQVAALKASVYAGSAGSRFPEADSTASGDQIDRQAPQPLKVIFQGQSFPLDDCKLIESNARLNKKQAKYVLEISRQSAAPRVLPSFFAPSFQKCLQGEPTRPDITSSLPEAGSPLSYAFASLPSPDHLMQDAHTVFRMDVLTPEGNKPADFFAVLDGHGFFDVSASEFCRDNIQATLRSCFDSLNKDGSDASIANGLRNAFVCLDAALQNYLRDKHNFCGTTACLLMILNGKIYCANVGDSRAIFFFGGIGASMNLTFDFKAGDSYADKSVIKRGGTVSEPSPGMGKRVLGQLAMTRAIGDKYLCNANGQSVICSRPMVTVYPLGPLLEKYPDDLNNCSIVIASDGLWDMASSRDVSKCLSMKNADMTPSVCAQMLVHASREGWEAHVQTMMQRGVKCCIDDITVGVIPMGPYAIK